MMTKRRSRAIPPVLVRCNEEHLEELRASIDRTEKMLIEKKLRFDYNLSDNKIASVEITDGPFGNIRITHSISGIYGFDGDYSWGFHPHLPLSQTPPPNGKETALQVIKIAQSILDRAIHQSKSRLQKTLDNNNLICDLLAHAMSKGAEDQAKMIISMNSEPKMTIMGRRQYKIDEPSVQLWLDKLMPCLFIDHDPTVTTFGVSAIARPLPADPVQSMMAIARCAEVFPDLQPPMRENTT